MYEKYTGLPDTTKSSKSAKPANSRNGSQTTRSKDNTARTQGTGRIHYNDNEVFKDYSYDSRSSDRPAPRSSGNGRSGGSGSGSGRAGSRGSKKRKRQQRRRLILLASTVILLALIAGAVVLLVKSCQEPVEVDVETDSFRSGVYINGTDVSGKTIEEARTQLASNEAYAINNIAITLAGEGFSEVITGENMGAASDLDAVMLDALNGSSNKTYYTTLTIDDDALAQRIDEINQTMSAPPTDATFTVEFSEAGKPQFTYLPGVAGVGVNVEATKALVHTAIENKQYQTTITAELTTVEPTITVEDVQAHTTLIGSFSTTYDYKGTAEDTEYQREVMIPNRAFNVQKSTDAINNQVIKPGSTWSFNKTVGDRTEKNGWKTANGIFGGDRYTEQYGGGVCQVSTTLYNALLECYSSVEIVERRKHSIPSTYVDKGLDATVDTNHIDFRFKNVSDYPLYIFAYTSNNKKSSSRKKDVNVLIYGEALPAGVTYQARTELVEEILPGEPILTESKNLFIGEEEIIADPRSGYKYNVYIEKLENGKVVSSTLMYMDNYEGNPMKKRVGIKPTPTPLLSPTPTPHTTATPSPTPNVNFEDLP